MKYLQYRVSEAALALTLNAPISSKCTIWATTRVSPNNLHFPRHQKSTCCSENRFGFSGKLLFLSLLLEKLKLCVTVLSTWTYVIHRTDAFRACAQMFTWSEKLRAIIPDAKNIWFFCFLSAGVFHFCRMENSFQFLVSRLQQKNFSESHLVSLHHGSSFTGWIT